ncbi:hypothetical protein BsWGS_10317 [Bradybaena similaris]
MEAFNFNDTNFNDTSRYNGSVDLSYWEGLSIRNVPQYRNCFWVYHFEFKNMTLQLYPWEDIKKLSSICDHMVLARRVLFWLSLVIGIPGNILALLTILRFPRTTGTFYLTLLTIIDFLALLTKAFNVAILSFYIFDSVSCKIALMSTNFTATYANWMLVLISFERLITVLFPLKKSYYFTMTRARLSALIVAVILFLFNSVYLWIITAGAGCGTSYPEFYSKYVHASTALYSYIPSVLLIVMVLLISRALTKIQKNREYIFCGEEGASVVALTQQRLQEQAKAERSITMMLVFAVVAFLLLTVPLCFVLAFENSSIVESSNFSRSYYGMSYFIAQGLATLTHAINFFIYFLSTERFRSNFRQMFGCLPADRRHSYNDRSLNTEEDHV